MSKATKTFRPWHPEQSHLLPPSPRDWLPSGHLAYFLLDVVGQLDLTAIVAPYQRELRGKPPHDPRMMVTLLAYGYCVGVPSSRKIERKIERKTHEDVGFRVIAGGNHPDHTALSEFRRIHLAALSGLFLQVLKLCRKAGLVKLGRNAKFGQSGPMVGSFDGGYGAGLLAAHVGQKKAREIWFLCRQYDAKEALEMGLVNAVVPVKELEAETVSWAREMLRHSPMALRLLKASLNAADDGLAGIQQLAGDATMLFYLTEEGQEGRNAYQEKREPNFNKFPKRP